ncbi:protein DpdE [Micromonospora saelicesensis]|uniref:protein DpdE n=1 Tax=Micromonospora saelicesensis TaxID=285676 RepID=UPI000DD86DBB|nr:protein DpdE [Micromonospora saelicesensis]
MVPTESARPGLFRLAALLRGSAEVSSTTASVPLQTERQRDLGVHRGAAQRQLRLLISPNCSQTRTRRPKGFFMLGDTVRPSLASAYIPSARHSIIAHGQFVQHPRIPGIARVRARVGSSVEVEAFESVAEPVAATWSLPASECRPVILPAETRVFWRDVGSGMWHAGRVVAGGPDDYAIRLPNSEFDVQVSGAELRVRWHRPVRSPIEVLAVGANESPYYRGARLPMLHSLVGQRAASANFSALVSSAIEIYPHQIDAALTVLTDPVQRYLLADEVGLGKTIEAGLVIRQHLIDHPTARIAVLAPDILRRQWNSELHTKFFTEDFPQSEIRIGQHETPERWTEYHGFDLVVIDEVHNLTRAGNPRNEPYPQLAALAHAVPRLILLSATPATARPELHLSLLHLLDPHLYRWADLEQFRQRFADRRRLANAVHGLNADLEILLPDVLLEVAELIPDDVAFTRLADEVRQFLTEDDELRDEADRPRLAGALEVLRAHISETYRLHRRMIRHRRTQVLRMTDDELLPFEVSGRRRPDSLMLGGQRADLVYQALLGWQQRVAQWLLDHDDDQRAHRYGQVLAVLASRADELSDDLADALRWRLDGEAAAADRAGLSATERALLRQAPPLPFERQTLAELANAAGTAALRLNGLAQAVKGRQRPVVFCGPGQLADDLGAVLARRTGWTVLRHSRTRTAAQVAADLDRWRGGGMLLLVDGTGEDGLNLQDADVVVHLRLPWSPNRLEQRLGRVDRFAGCFGARGEPAAQYCEAGGSADESFVAAWRELLTRAFGAFDGSLSALQDILDELQVQAWEVALREGPTAMTAFADKITAALGRERREIEAMDALESVHDATLGARLAKRIDRMEQSWPQHERALRGLIHGASGGLRLTAEPDSGPVVTIGVDHRNPPLISPLVLAEEGGRLPADSMTGTFNRNVSLRRPGVRLFRIGNPLIELLAAVVAIDDRGQASALWRPGRSQESVHFGFDVMVEADLDVALSHPAAGAEARHAIRRQADLLLPPFVDRMWLDAAGVQVTDETLLRWLNAPYTQRDLNLNSDRIIPLLDSFGGAERFAAAARRAEATARHLVAQGKRVRDRTAVAYKEGNRALAVQRTQALARQAAGRLLSDTESYVTDVALSDLLVDGLRTPRLRVMAAICVAGGDLWGAGHAPR